MLTSEPTGGTMAQLRLRLLGGFEVQANLTGPLSVPTRKAQALLAYLALTPGQPHPRDKLVALLWPDASPGAARTALRQTLFVLRKALGPAEPAPLVATGDAITLPADAVETDVGAFERAVAAGTPATLEEAASLYAGDFLAGLGAVPPPFEEWLTGERERLRELALEVHARLLAQRRAAGALAPAVQSALRLLTLDPLQEAVHRTLMRLYAQLGRRDAAFRQYQECVDVLRRELGVEPEAETQALYREILRQRPVRIAARPGAPGRSEVPLVGRAPEVKRLLEALAEAWAGQGRVVALLGEAGIGKTRLLAELAAEAERRGGAVVLGRAYESEQILPFGPWVGGIRDAGVPTDPRTFDGLAPASRAELGRLFPELSEGSPAASSPADQLRLFHALGELLRGIALTRPLACLLEDAHWADDATLRLLAFLARRLHGAPILLALSAREEELADHPLLSRALDELAAEDRLVRLPLARLGRDDTLALVQRLGRADSRAAADAQRGEQVWAMSAGNPFIVVETMRAIGEGVALESRGGLSLPARAREMIAGRLGRLSDRARQLVRVAAVIAREFEFPLLQRAAGVDEREAAEGLEELVRRRVVHGVGERFDFTHERIRDVVTGELVAPQRQALHAAVATALEEMAGEDVSRHWASLGAHYGEAGIWDKAVRFLREAGRQATERCAYREAAVRLEQARAALAHLPDSRATLEQAVEIRLDLRNALLPLGDFPAILHQMREAVALAERLGDRRRQVRAAAFLLNQLWMAGEHRAALAEGQRVLATALAVGDPGLVILIRTRLGEAHHLCGDYREAATLFTQNIDALKSAGSLERFGLLQPPAVHSRAWLVSSLAELGRLEAAHAMTEEASAIARELDEPVALSFAWACRGILALQQGHLAAAIEAFHQALEVRRGDHAPWLPRFAGALGYACALSGQVPRGLDLLRDGMDQGAAIGVAGGRSLLMAWLAEAHVLANDVPRALDAAGEAVALARRHSERGHLAWALRARAEAEAHGQAEDAERAVATYGEALALAGELEMRPLVAHCRLGLGSLYARVGQREQARIELAAAQDLFAEMGMELWRARAEHALAGSA